jgi:hypothetical protein
MKARLAKLELLPGRMGDAGLSPACAQGAVTTISAAGRIALRAMRPQHFP